MVVRPRESVTTAAGVRVPAMPMGAVTPEKSLTVCPAKVKRQLFSVAPPTALASTAYCRQLMPRTHSPHCSSRALSFTSATVSVALGRMLSGT